MMPEGKWLTSSIKIPPSKITFSQGCNQRCDYRNAGPGRFIRKSSIPLIKVGQIIIILPICLYLSLFSDQDLLVLLLYAGGPSRWASQHTNLDLPEVLATFSFQWAVNYYTTKIICIICDVKLKLTGLVVLWRWKT